MASPKKVEGTCGEHKLAIEDESQNNNERVDFADRGQWLRAAILGANDGLISTTSLMLGVGAAKEDRWSMALSGLAGALAGACSMAVGEFVSVATQRDIEKVAKDGKLCRDHELCDGQIDDNEVKHVNEANIFSPSKVLSNHKIKPSPRRSPLMRVVTEDATRYVEGESLPNPYKAASASALAFLCGSFFPLLPACLVVENTIRIVVIVFITSVALILFGGFGAYLGGSAIRVSALRVLLGGWIAMAVTYGLLKPFDHAGGEKGNQR
ncbi:Ccc1 family [Dillenia turbinata]|uniref:Vacuolar iron transporter n=1 Tax=Dillenia turbinata TaxID=194707 RepID=A0AAN8ZB17_9MAGN